MNNQNLMQVMMLQGQQVMLQAQVTVVAMMRRRRRRRRRRPRTWWVRPWLTVERRISIGQYDQLLQELRMEDQTFFFNYLRMEPPLFDELLHRVGPRITKGNTNWRPALEPGLKLAVTIRYLATGERYSSLQYQFRVAHNTICLFIPYACRAHTDYLPIVRDWSSRLPSACRPCRVYPGCDFFSANEDCHPSIFQPIIWRVF